MSLKVPCPECKQETIFLQATDHFHNGKEDEIVEIVECVECGAKFANIYRFNRQISLVKTLESDQSGVKK